MDSPDYCPTAHSLFYKLAETYMNFETKEVYSPEDIDVKENALRQATLDQHLETCVECAAVVAVVRASANALSEYVAQLSSQGVESSPGVESTVPRVARGIRLLRVN